MDSMFFFLFLTIHLSPFVFWNNLPPLHRTGWFFSTCWILSSRFEETAAGCGHVTVQSQWRQELKGSNRMG
jgi:hypothetical protein